MTTDQQWNADCAKVTQLMTKHVAQFVTPLSMSEQFGSGTAWGTGTYIQGETQMWVLTAAHVITNLPPNGRLAHLPRPGGEYNAGLDSPILAAWPIDAGALPVHRDPKYMPPADRVVPQGSVATKYEPVDEELLFWMGFPGYTVERNDPRLRDKLRVSMYEQLTTPAKPMLTQAIHGLSIKASNFDPDKHVALHYPSAATRATDGQTVPLPNAAGMSGSAVWDTKFVACASTNTPWSPEMAQICGVIWAVLDDPEVVFFTKIEHVRAVLPAAF